MYYVQLIIVIKDTIRLLCSVGMFIRQLITKSWERSLEKPDCVFTIRRNEIYKNFEG